MNSIGKVYIVGAGCGKYDLITLRGMRALRKCSVVVYDSLIDERLLDFAPERSEKICVGKRAGHHSETQERINMIIAEKALSGENVVRLKGGDPFVFGRGGEEIIALRELNIPYDVIPGITSAAAVPELAGIPVTHRRLSRSFHVITGHTADELLPENLEKYAQLGGTLVFLMGLKNLRLIAEHLMMGGMCKDTPAAVISCGGTVNQRVVTDRIGGIAESAEHEGLEAPAVIIVGETAQMDLSPTIALPLNGITVTVTGTRRLTEKLSVQLCDAGADVTVMNLLKISEYCDDHRVDDALRNIENYEWIALTSINGAEIFLKNLRRLRIDVRRLSGIRFAVIGSATAGVLESIGIFPELVPRKHTSAELGRILSESMHSDERLLILRAERASSELTDILRKSKMKFDEIKTYDTVWDIRDQRASEVRTDFITFASASGVDAFFGMGYMISPQTKIICIGEVTANSLRKYGVENMIISDVQTANGITEKIIQYSNCK